MDVKIKLLTLFYWSKERESFFFRGCSTTFVFFWAVVFLFYSILRVYIIIWGDVVEGKQEKTCSYCLRSPCKVDNLEA